MSSYSGSCADSSRAMPSMHCEKNAIHAVPSDCSRWPPVGSGALRSNTPMLSRPRNPPSNTLRPVGSLRLIHHVKLTSSFWNARFNHVDVARAALLELGLVDEQRRPGVHRRVDVAEVPLVGGQLPARVEVQLAQHQLELGLGEVDVDHRQRHGVEGEVPRRVPRVLPRVGHRDDVVVDHVEPAAVADVGRRSSRSGWTWCSSSQRSRSKQ